MNENVNDAQAHTERSIEISIETAQKSIDVDDAIKRLFNNKDFKLVFVDGYFKDEPARLVSLLTDAEFQDEAGQTGLKNDMLGISALRQHLIMKQRIGTQMRNVIKSNEEVLENLRDAESE